MEFDFILKSYVLKNSAGTFCPHPRYFTKRNIFCCRLFYGAPLNDGMWHSLCVTWKSADGIWSAYVDGKTNRRRSGGKFKNNRVVQFSGEQLVLGQNVQDGAFKDGRAFTGNISRVNMWNYSMTEEEVQSMATNCSSPVGNVLKWRDFWKGLQGNVELSGESQCIGAGELIIIIHLRS